LTLRTDETFAPNSTESPRVRNTHFLPPRANRAGAFFL